MKKGSIKLSDINFLDPGLQENPYEAYEVLRKEAPVYLSPDTGFFVVSKYNDLKRVLTDFEFFSREKTPMLICGANASFLAFSMSTFELIACLKF